MFERNIMDNKLIECFKVLGDPVRFQIFDSLKNRSICACEFSEVLNLDVSQPTLSFHLKKMRECGLLEETKDGTRKIMSINQDMLIYIKQYWSK
jgi:ArsR family transcriptional regulator, arsenate/arsenite/antimonite-responsive transcriptional repressor